MNLDSGAECSVPNGDYIPVARQQLLHVEEAGDLLQDEADVCVEVVHSADLVVNADSGSQGVGEGVNQLSPVVVVRELWKQHKRQRDEEKPKGFNLHLRSLKPKDYGECVTLFFLLSLYLMRSRMKFRTSLGHKFCTSLNKAMATGIVYTGRKEKKVSVKSVNKFPIIITILKNLMTGRPVGKALKCIKAFLRGGCPCLLQEVALEVDEAVGLDDVWAALAAEHACEKGFHGRWSRPCAHHGIGNLQQRNSLRLRLRCRCF